MMLLDEQERGLTYDWVLSLRIDSVALERKNVTDAPVLATSKWLQTSINATLAAPPGTVLLYQDFVWFADRPTALSMAADARVGTDRAFETRPRGLRGGLRRRHAGRDVDIPRGDRLPSKVGRRSRPAPRHIHVVAAAEFSRADSICRAHAPSNYPRGTRGVAATRLHGISMSWPRTAPPTTAPPPPAAARPFGYRAQAAWEVMKQNVWPVAIDRCRYANSAWARECSLFTRVATDHNLSSVDLGRVALTNHRSQTERQHYPPRESVASPSTGLAASSCSSHSSGDIVIDEATNPQIAFGVFMLGTDAAVVPQCFPKSLHWRLWPSGSTYGDSHRRDLASVSHKWRHDAKC